MNQRSKKWLSITSEVAILLIAVLLAVVAFQRWAAAPQRSSALIATERKNSSRNAEEPSLSDKVNRIVSSMSPEEMVGQLLVVGFSGKEPDYYVTRMIRLRHVGGVILFERNIENPTQVTRLIAWLQEMAESNGDPPLFIAVDQEGGEVSRFKVGVSPLPAPVELAKLGPTAVEEASERLARELRAMGVNVNLAPVVDVASQGSIMARRSYGSDPATVARLGAAFISGTKRGGVIPCAKHFPGLGRAVADPHNGPIEIKADFATFYQSDLLPFSQAINEGVEMIMVSHARYPALDARNPASLSLIIQTVVLRGLLGYQGLIITDDLEMGAVNGESSVGQLAVEAVKAGADLLLVCHTPEKQKEAYEALLAALRKGEIQEDRLKESVRRIVALKLVRLK